MSTGLINSETNDALQRAKELASAQASAITSSLKRGADQTTDECVADPAKRSIPGNGTMDGTAAGMSIRMPLGMGGPGMGAPGQFNQLGQPLGGQMGNPQENVVEVITVPDHCVGLVIGRGGEQITQIQSQSGARVQMSPDSEGSGQRQCTLQGSKMSVERAKQLIFEVIHRAGNRPPPNRFEGQQAGGPGQITTEMLIPGPKCGLIIGKQGETIKNLQEQAGVKMIMIQETQEVTGQSKPLRITGDPDKVENAKRLVNEILNSRDDGSGRSMGGSQGGFGGHDGATAKGEVVVPRSSVGMIIGKGGETIKRLGLETGTKIQFKPDEDPSTPDRCAVITGTREQIYKATELITELVQKSCQNGAGTDTFFMHVPANKTGLVIGKGGETIKQICGESGAHCELSRDPPPNANEKVFIIKGTPFQIHNAQHIIRIKVGDVPPGTPLPPFNGPGGPTMARPEMYPGQGAPGSFNGAAQFGQMQPNNQWSNNFAQQAQPQANGWPAANPQYFDASQGAAQQQYGGMPAQQPYGQQQYAPAQPAASQPAAAAPAANGQPTINPQTGQPDYSAQWADYYRSMGMHEQAAMIENQVKQNAARGAAQSAATQPQAQFGNYQAAAAAPATQAASMPTYAAASQAQQPYTQYQQQSY